MDQGVEHISVMPGEVEELLALKPGAVAVDCTLGLGGHALAMAHRAGTGGRIIGLDQDDHAIEKARERLRGFEGRLDIVKGNFRRVDQVLDGLGVKEVDAFLFDVGVSSLQLDDAARGFSFRGEGALDMRMDPQAPVSAYDLVNDLGEEELSNIFWRYGEERFARRVARMVVQARAARPLSTTKELADIISRAVPHGYEKGRMHPATRAFQGLRIAVNHELDALEEGLLKAFPYLKVHGRMVVISFHSLEDRISKQIFRDLARQGRGELLTKKPLRPADAEAEANPRARSARLRALERLS